MYRKFIIAGLIALAVTTFNLQNSSPVLSAQTEPDQLQESMPLAVVSAKPEPKYTRTEDLIYGYRDGHALTMDAISPNGARNGAGVIICVSKGYKSSREMLDIVHPYFTTPLLDRGYTVFAVMHSSQPKYTVPEIVDDVHRAVRFIKSKSGQFGVDPNRLGITGGSSGGHLSLMMGCSGTVGSTDSKDPVERESSKVAAVACFFPPTDFVALESNCPKEFAASFDFRELDTQTGMFTPVTTERRNEIGRKISPVNHVSKNSAPTLIIHGDKDELVPLSQSESMIAKFNQCGVECKLTVKPGKGHGWLTMQQDLSHFADWFDLYLLGSR